MSGSYKSKRKKDFPCIRCDEHVKKTEKAVKCAMCDLWVHKSCEKMSDETFHVLDMQNEETGQCFWSCKSCKSYAMKFDKRIRDIESRVKTLEEENIPEMEEDIANAQKDIESLKERTKNLSDGGVSSGSASAVEVTTAVFDEMRERKSRSCNLIIHNLNEPGNDIKDRKERVAKDKEALNELFTVLELSINVEDSTRFAKRLGPANESSPRPLLVGITDDVKCKSVLEKSPNLSKKEKPWSEINIVRDLTKLQRKEESRMREEVEKKNEELSEDEMGNWKWKVVGRRGERKIVKIAIEEEEEGQGTSGGTKNRRKGPPRKKAATKE
jgi:uncharacterized coiled-coil protein SlyX